MSRTIVLRKATRIEGNADIQLDIQDGHVKSARFIVQDFRGIEKFLCGRRAAAIPALISRICGLCSASQQIASLKAIEAALGLEVPPAVQVLRKIILCGEWISSHALSYFFFSRPDFSGSSRGIFDLMEKEPEIAGKAIAVRRSGQRIIELLGGRAIHPVTMGIGGFLDAPSRDALQEVGQIAAELRNLSFGLLDQLAGADRPAVEIPFPEGQCVHFLSYDDEEEDGTFKVFDRAGRLTAAFGRNEFEEHVSEMRAGWSFAKFPYLRSLGFPEGIVLVGPLARLLQPGGVLEDRETRDLPLAKDLADPGNLRLDHYDPCRLLEICWASVQIERLAALVEDPKGAAGACGACAASGRGAGAIEAPRGVLLHSLLLREGFVEKIRLLVATQFNNPFINLMIQRTAEGHLDGDSLTEEGGRLIGRCVRIFDPCLSCATH